MITSHVYYEIIMIGIAFVPLVIYLIYLAVLCLLYDYIKNNDYIRNLLLKHTNSEFVLGMLIPIVNTLILFVIILDWVMYYYKNKNTHRVILHD